MNEVNVLIATRKFLEYEARWMKGEYARKLDGNYCSPLDDDAVQWCAIGAVVHIAGSYKEANHAIHWLSKQMKPTKEVAVTQWQDQPEIIHQDVLDLFDKAITAAEKTHKEWKKELAG